VDKDEMRREENENKTKVKVLEKKLTLALLDGCCAAQIGNIEDGLE
jgi:hypothetical protein